MTDLVEEPHLSWSQLQVLGDCGEKFRLSYRENVPRAPQGALIAGRAIHAAIEWAETPQSEFDGWCPIQDLWHGTDEERIAFKSRLAMTFVNLLSDDVEEAGGTDAIRWAGRKLINTSVEYKRFAEYVRTHSPHLEGWTPFRFRSADPETAAELNRLGAADDIPRIVKILQAGSEDDRWWRKMGPVFLRRYCDLRLQDEASGVKLWDSHVERRITARLPSGTLLTGFVDAAMIVTGDGEPRIRDYKSGRIGGGSPMQLAVYGWLIGEATGVHPSSGEFVYLRGDSPSKLQPSPVDGDRFQRLVAMVPEVMARHEAQAAAGVFPYNPGWQCGS
ncbi:MAG TPA: PD-(D/E)XK nuclease family protein, partial [Actinomycetota bacterium]|nr:PD-(D/E)XK nuclease family protein [Actinomycetota bacterium]